MVTARPMGTASFVDEGTGLPDIERAYRWLNGAQPVPDIRVRVAEHSQATAAFHEILPGVKTQPNQQFELLRRDSAPQAVYTLRSDAPWLTTPARVTLAGPKTSVQLRYNLSSLKAPGAHVGTVTGWSADSLAGPAFRLVNTLVVPAAVVSGPRELRSGVQIESGSVLRTFFRADTARPFAVQVSSTGREKGLAFLHEPDGMPYREESARTMGSGEAAADYQVDARDVVTGTYEIVAAAVSPSPNALHANVRVTNSPFRLRIARKGSDAVGTVSNVSGAPATTELAMLLGGAERIETVVARGSAVRRIPFTAPRWARAVVVEITMDRGQWGKFTDFGVTLFDSAGRQIDKQPLNYAVGRVQAPLPEGQGDTPVVLALFPGFADGNSDQHGLSGRQSDSMPILPSHWGRDPPRRGLSLSPQAKMCRGFFP